jgi:hypothetical protein
VVENTPHESDDDKGYIIIDTSQGDGRSVHGSGGSLYASARCDEMPDDGRGIPGNVIPAGGRRAERVLDSISSPGGD